MICLIGVDLVLMSPSRTGITTWWNRLRRQSCCSLIWSSIKSPGFTGTIASDLQLNALVTNGQEWKPRSSVQAKSVAPNPRFSRHRLLWPNPTTNVWNSYEFGWERQHSKSLSSFFLHLKMNVDHLRQDTFSPHDNASSLLLGWTSVSFLLRYLSS